MRGREESRVGEEGNRKGSGGGEYKQMLSLVCE